MIEPPAPPPPAPSFWPVLLPALPSAEAVPEPMMVPVGTMIITIPPPAAPLLAAPLLGVPVPLLDVPAPPPPPITRRDADTWPNAVAPFPPEVLLDDQVLPPMP